MKLGKIKQLALLSWLDWERPVKHRTMPIRNKVSFIAAVLRLEHEECITPGAWRRAETSSSRLTVGDIFYSRRTARNSVDADKLFYREQPRPTTLAFAWWARFLCSNKIVLAAATGSDVWTPRRWICKKLFSRSLLWYLWELACWGVRLTTLHSPGGFSESPWTPRRDAHLFYWLHHANMAGINSFDELNLILALKVKSNMSVYL